MSVRPKVSIITLTYNHENYIEDALRSFVNQIVSFDFEVIVSDDASQDETQKIIREYAKLYPNIIKPIFHKKNIGAVPNLHNALKQVKGEYLSLCDGDDYWTDTLKLQKQVTFMDKNPEYYLYFHDVNIIFQDAKVRNEIYPRLKSDNEVSLSGLIKNNFIPTNSVMYRSLDYKNIPDDILPPDWYLHIFHAKNGKIGYLKETMATYRRHSNGIWWDSIKNPDELWIKYGAMHQKFYKELKKLFNSDRDALDIINESMSKFMLQLADIDKRKGTKLFENAIKVDPTVIEITLQYAYEQNMKFEAYWLESSTYTKKLQKDIDLLNHEKHTYKNKYEDLHQQLINIDNSRIWKLRNLIRGKNNQQSKNIIKKANIIENFSDSNLPHVLVTMPWMTFGGAETLTYNYCREISKDINITFMTGLPSENEWEYKFKKISQNIYHLPEMFKQPAQYFDFISDYITNNKVDILHLVHNGFMFYMLPELKKRHPRLKIVLTLFNDRVPEYVNGAINYQKQVDRYVTDNNNVANSISKQLKTKTKITVIPNGIDTDNEFNPDLFNHLEERKKLGIKVDELAIFFIGRLSEEKNPNVFIEAAQICSKRNKKNKLKFFIVGDGSMRKEVEDLIIKNKSASITYLGYQTDVAKYLSAADIFVLPSSIEGFPLSLLEAMAMNVVPIASDVGAVSDVLETDAYGFVVRPESAEEISEKIILLSKDTKKLIAMKKLARGKVEQKYSSRMLVANYRNLYEEVIK